MARIVDVFNETKRMLELLISTAREFGADTVKKIISGDLEEGDPGWGDLITGRVPKGSITEIATWLKRVPSVDRLFLEENIASLEEWLAAAPAGTPQPNAPEGVPNTQEQLTWLRRHGLSGVAGSAADALIDIDELDARSKEDWFSWDPITAPDTTTQPGEEDMPGPNVQRGPARRPTTDFGFIGDDPTTLVKTPKTISGDGEKDGEEEDGDPYDLGALQNLIGGLDFFEGDDWLIQPEDIPEGFPPIDKPWNVIDYLSYFEVDQYRAKEFLRKTPGFATYTKWDADWSMMTPAEQDRQIENTLHNVWVQAQAFGLDVEKDHPVLREIAIKIKRHGWTAEDTRVAQMFYEHKEFVMDQAVGKHQTAVDDVTDTARTHMITLSADDRNRFAKRINLGLETIDSLDTKFRKMAYDQYPHLRKLMDDGNNLGDYVSPYQLSAEELLERPVDMYGRDRKMFNEIFMHSEGDGTIRPMSQHEADVYIKKTGKYGWDKTQNAKAEYADKADMILRKWGAIA